MTPSSKIALVGDRTGLCWGQNRPMLGTTSVTLSMFFASMFYRFIALAARIGVDRSTSKRRTEEIAINDRDHR